MTIKDSPWRRVYFVDRFWIITHEEQANTLKFLNLYYAKPVILSFGKIGVQAGAVSPSTGYFMFRNNVRFYSMSAIVHK